MQLRWILLNVHVFYAGSRDGKIFMAALNTERIFNHNHEMHIIGAFPNHRKQLDSSKRMSSSLQSSSRKQGSLLPPPLEKYRNSTTDEYSDVKTIVSLPDGRSGVDVSYMSCQAIFNKIKEFQMERLKADCKRSVQMVDGFKKIYEDLREFYEGDFLKRGQTKTSGETGN